MNEELARRFYPYQLRWMQDDALQKIGLWARQTGKDYTCAAEAVLDCAERPGTHWLIVACGERQARESLDKAREWAEWMAEREGFGVAPARSVTAREIRFENGSRITALPAKAGTIRGYSANIILTEFAFHDDPEGIWRAVYPSVSNPLKGGVKKLRIISTPNGQGNFFHQLWSAGRGFSKHRVSIESAQAQGLPIDLERLRAGLGSAEAWAQEYQCEFIDQSCVLLPYELIEPCQSPEALEHSSPEQLSRLGRELYLGIDFGRKEDLTVCWVLQKLGEEFWTREVLPLFRMPTPGQLEALRPRVALARRVCVDYTGAGVGLGDLLMREFGAAKIGLCHFTASLKQELFPKLRAALEQRKVWIPGSAAIREDLHGVHRIISAAGQVTYRAAHTADGHSDRCTALALALRAAEASLAPARPVSVGKKIRSVRGHR